MKKLIVLLCLVAPIFGGSEETKTDWTWITLGSDAMPAIRAEFNDREWRVLKSVISPTTPLP